MRHQVGRIRRAAIAVAILPVLCLMFTVLVDEPKRVATPASEKK
jgi:hypothetical protein